MTIRTHQRARFGTNAEGTRPNYWQVLTLLFLFLIAGVSSVAAQTQTLPGTIQAENFDNGLSGYAYWDSTPGNSGGQYRSTDVDIEVCSEGGYDVGWVVPGEWLNYTVSVPSSGTYTLDLRVASANGGSLHVTFNGADVTGTVTVPATGGWQNWTTIRKTVSLTAGTQSMRVLFDSGNLNVNWYTVSATTATSATSLPGTIQAEDFDNGPNGTAYYDSTAGNSGGSYRATDVDIESSTEGGYDVGWVYPGEWLNYTVNVAAAGTYNLDLRLAAVVGGSLHVEFGGVNVTGTISVPSTGGWQSWTTLRKTVSLSGGTQAMRVVFDSGNVNFNWISVSTSSSSTSGTSAPFSGVAVAIPGWVQAEDFDTGGQGVGYYDTTSGNSGGAYRASDVDIETTPSGGYAVDYTAAGEWLKYTVNVAAAGSYTAVARVASSGTGGTFHIEFNGSDKTGPISVPNTGGWGTYQDVAVPVSLSAGVQAMRIVFDANGSTGAVTNIGAVRFDTVSSSSPSPSISVSTSSGGGRLRMMTWNIDFGGGNPYGQAQLIASTGADVVTLQEASTYDENMPVTYRDRLQQLTGQTWYTVWGPSNPGSTASQGNLILSRYPIVDATTVVFDGAGMSRALVNVGGVYVNVFDVHLEYYDTSKRTSQLNQFMAWARSFSGPRIAAGDFNSWWGEWWIQQMDTEYSDTWEYVTGSVQNGYTLNGAVRFDYIFRSFTDETRLTPTACWVPTSSLSDHWPVVADFTVR